MDETGYIMHGGTVVNATIISALGSARNKERTRDPEVHQTKKGIEWKFGMKVHVGVSTGAGTTVTAETTPINVSDIATASKLLREYDAVAYGDSGYLGIKKCPEIAEDAACSPLVADAPPNDANPNRLTGSDLFLL